MYRINNDKRVVESSKMIYEAIRELSYKKDYQLLTIKDIVDRANIGRSTFYRNFDTMDDVLIKKSDKEFEQCISFLLMQFNPSEFSNGNEVMMKFIYLFFTYWESNSEILELLMHIDKFTLIEDSLKKIMIKTFGMFGEKQGVIEYLQYQIAIRVGVVRSVLEQWIKDHKNIPPKKLSSLIVNLLTTSGDIIYEVSSKM